MTLALPKTWSWHLSSSQQEVLKWLAIGSMALDHINQVTLNGGLPALTYVGRLAFPLFGFLIAYNIAKRGVPPQRYVVPLLAFGVLSQPVYIWAFERSELNILFTLLLGVSYLICVRWLRGKVTPFWAHVLSMALVILPSGYVSYQLFGPFLIPILAAWLERESFVALPFTAIYLMFTNSFAPISVYTLLLLPTVFVVTLTRPTLSRSNKWLFYAFYPVHLAVLKGLELGLT